MVRREIIRSPYIVTTSLPDTEPAVRVLVSHKPRCAEGTPESWKPKEWQMYAKQLILAGCAVMALSTGTAQAGPCDMTGKSASAHDAGSGPTPGNTGQTTGTATGTSAGQHAANSTMNRAAGDVATSSQDAQKQMQAQPTAAQQAQGAKSTGQGC
jgi:negative regulator of sigma E activity